MTEPQKPDIKALRRKIAGAKSYLSRLTNESREVLRSARDDKVDTYRALHDKRIAQEEKFRALVKELREQEGRD